MGDAGLEETRASATWNRLVLGLLEIINEGFEAFCNRRVKHTAAACPECTNLNLLARNCCWELHHAEAYSHCCYMVYLWAALELLHLDLEGLCTNFRELPKVNHEHGCSVTIWTLWSEPPLLSLSCIWFGTLTCSLLSPYEPRSESLDKA